MPRGWWVNVQAKAYATWRDPLRRAALALGVLTFAVWVLMLGQPNFTNASRPRFWDPVISMKFVSTVEDVDLILGQEPSIDRETMRIKTRIDYAFIVGYAALLAVLGAIVMREGGWRTAAGIVIAICGLAAGVFDVLENRAILKVLDTPLQFTTAGMLDAIRVPAMASWALAGVALVLLIAHKAVRRP